MTDMASSSYDDNAGLRETARPRLGFPGLELSERPRHLSINYAGRGRSWTFSRDLARPATSFPHQKFRRPCPDSLPTRKPTRGIKLYTVKMERRPWNHPPDRALPHRACRFRPNGAWPARAAGIQPLGPAVVALASSTRHLVADHGRERADSAGI
jgi:hypothetical protein